MQKPQICHWLLYQPNGKCRTVFAPGGDGFEKYYRVGPVSVSPQFVFPLVFAMTSSESVEQVMRDHWVRLKFEFLRDDPSQPSPAFWGMPSLKVATLISELTNSIAEWTEQVGGHFESLTLADDRSGALELIVGTNGASNIGAVRCEELIKAGIEMMGYSRGLVVSFN